MRVAQVSMNHGMNFGKGNGRESSAGLTLANNGFVVARQPHGCEVSQKGTGVVFKLFGQDLSCVRILKQLRNMRRI